MDLLWPRCKVEQPKVRYNDHHNQCHTISRTELLLSVIPEVTDNDNDLTCQRDPERYRRERTVLEPISNIPQGEVGEHQLSRDGCSSHNDNDGAQHLGEGQGRADVETREGLE